MLEFVPVAAMALLVLKVVDFLRYLVAANVNGVITQLAAWAAGILVLLLVSHTNWAGAVIIGGFPLSKLGVWSLVFYGMATASAASVGKDALKAVDNSQSAAVPPLVGPPS